MESRIGKQYRVERVEDLVEDVAGALREPLGPLLGVLRQPFEDLLHRLQGYVRQRDEVVAPDKRIQLGRVEALGVLVVPGEVEDDEEVVVVVVDLRALAPRSDILEVELVERELRIEPGDVSGGRRLDLDPAQPGILDHAHVDVVPRKGGDRDCTMATWTNAWHGVVRQASSATSRIHAAIGRCQADTPPCSRFHRVPPARARPVRGAARLRFKPCGSSSSAREWSGQRSSRPSIERTR